jgi:membrane-bound lytic murein transglycosylase B
MTTASTALGTAATDLSAITPPAAFQGTQDNVVAALQTAQKVLDTTGSYLSKRVYDPNHPDIKTQIKQQVTDALATAWASILNAAGQ